MMLQYANSVGAHPSEYIGEDHLVTPNNLMPFVQRVSVGRVPAHIVFSTKDGTWILSSVTLGICSDRWSWELDSNGVFSVKSVKKRIQFDHSGQDVFRFGWNSWLPKKVGIVAWRAEVNRLPTCDALRRRNIPVQDESCRFCSDFTETAEHVFNSCHFVQTVWQLVSQWCKVAPIYVFTVRDLLELYKAVNRSKRAKKVFNGIVQAVFWCIWKSQNAAMFDTKRVTVNSIIEEVKVMSFLWIKHRLGGKSFDLGNVAKV